MRIQQSVHNKIKKGIGILLSGVMVFGMAAGIIPCVKTGRHME